MPKLAALQARVDRYVRDQMSAAEAADFEAEMLESAVLQEELETALALRAALQQVAALETRRIAGDRARGHQVAKPDWRSFALAATVVLAVISTVMWWKVGIDAADLEQQLQSHAQPTSQLLAVKVPIMRSAGGQTPDVIVQKPAGRAAILLDIELGLRAREQAQLDFALVDPEGATLLAWQSAPTDDGRATAIIDNQQIPASRLWLQINTSNGELLERRLLEFRE
jgi:hypothetical protein